MRSICSAERVIAPFPRTADGRLFEFTTVTGPRAFCSTHLHDHADDVARSAKLAVGASGVEPAEEVFVEVALNVLVLGRKSGHTQCERVRASAEARVWELGDRAAPAIQRLFYWPRARNRYGWVR